MMWPITRRLASFYRSTLLRNKRIVAVIGSYGKTTTAHATALVLGDSASIRRGNSRAYVAHALLHTPLAKKHSVIEVGIDGKGQMAHHSRMLRPNVVVVTSIGWEHHRTFGDLEVTRAEKAKILKDLPQSAVAVINRDDPNVAWMGEQTSARVLTYGRDERSDLWVSELLLDWPQGMTFNLHYDGSTRRLRTRLVGRHFVLSLQAAALVALTEGFELDQVVPRLEELKPLPGRLQPVFLGNGSVLLGDEFKSSLETIDAALDLLDEVEAKRKIIVIGEVSEPPGSQGPIYRRLGERIAQIADLAFLLGGNARRYASGARRAGFPDESMINAKRDVLKVVEMLRSELREGDVVLVKGRDRQRLERIGLALTGRQVNCTKADCDAVARCQVCPELFSWWPRIPDPRWKPELT
jgi:UDP-N-acetylmuramoyl-tripeptide--D-alanyl-D-alanine ligase